MPGTPLIIDLKAGTKSIIKFGFAFQGFLVLAAVAGIFFLAFSLMDDLGWFSLFLVAIGIFFFYIALKYLDNAFHREQIIVDGDILTIRHKKWGNEKKRVFNLGEIMFFGHAGTREYTEHPMNNSIVDFTGLGTGERELQFLIDDGTIEIETRDDVFRFGKNMTSWDTEEVIEQIEQHTGKKFINKYPVHEGE